MPAPQATTIQTNLKAALLAKGFTKKSYVNGAVVEDPTSLPDHLQKLVDAWSNGDASWFALWQATQVVSIPVTSVPGTPSVGVLP